MLTIFFSPSFFSSSVPDRKRKIKGIDYIKEIPFQRKAPAGFYEIPDEELRPPGDPSFVGVSYTYTLYFIIFKRVFKSFLTQNR